MKAEQTGQDIYAFTAEAREAIYQTIFSRRDVRGQFLPKAEALPLHTLPERIHELSPAEKLLIVCRSGARSEQACMYLQ